MDYCDSCMIDLVVDLVSASTIERLPENLFTTLAGCRIRQIDLAPFEASAPAKLRLALAHACAEIPSSAQQRGRS